MRSIRFPLLPTLLILAACGSPPAPTFSEAQRDSLATEVRQFVGELTAAMNSHDPERVLSLYQESDDFVYVGCTDVMFGYGDFAVRVTPYYRNKTDVTFQQEILGVQVLSPTTAVVTLRGSSTEAEALFWTEVLVRQDDGRWLIAQEHESWPGCPEPARGHPMGEMPDLGEPG